MVMHVELRHDDMMSSAHQEVQVVLVEDRDGDVASSLQITNDHVADRSLQRSVARDASMTCRDASLDNTRQTANTYLSILDLTRDDDDDDADDDDDDCQQQEEQELLDASVMFEELHAGSRHSSKWDSQQSQQQQQQSQRPISNISGEASAPADDSFLTAFQEMPANTSASFTSASSRSSSNTISNTINNTSSNTSNSHSHKGVRAPSPASTASTTSMSSGPSTSTANTAAHARQQRSPSSPSSASASSSSASRPTHASAAPAAAQPSSSKTQAHRKRSGQTDDATVITTMTRDVASRQADESGGMLGQLDSVTDTFLDSLCAVGGTSSASCAPCSSSTKSSAFGNACFVPASTLTSASSTELANRHEASLQIMELLGCAADPTTDELEHVWLGDREANNAAPVLDRRRAKRMSQSNRASNLQRLNQLYSNTNTATNNVNSSRSNSRSNSRSTRPVSSVSEHRRTRHGVNLLPAISPHEGYSGARNSVHGASKDSHKPQPLVRSQTLDERKLTTVAQKPISPLGLLDPLSLWIGGPGLEPIPQGGDDDDDVLDGYDSDPELPRQTRASDVVSFDQQFIQTSLMDRDDSATSCADSFDDFDFDLGIQQPQRPIKRSPARTPKRNSRQRPQQQLPSLSKMEQAAVRDTKMQYIVQETLNTTWTLIWHPNPENMKEFNIPSKPICINIWMERGTVLPHTGVVFEPQLMWRDAYQPKLLSHKTLTATATKPWSIRLLNTCRIVSMDTAGTICRTKYPLARQNSCLMLKTCQKQEFLLEAQSAAEMATISEHWKIVVARFASLAVTEDVDTISEEFFHNLNGAPNVGLPPI